MFDINKFKNLKKKDTRYEQQLDKLLLQGLERNHIEDAVQNAAKNIDASKKSFVIYGEPQSGKTEMMIALTAKLLDKGHPIIVILLNDNTELLAQNLKRFRSSGINPTPFDISEILTETIGSKNWIIFCKKNINDLNKLNDKLYNKGEKVVIDDEADFASPNAKINRNTRTAINKAIHILLGDNGIYIGVTATPARLDMNNTFDNMTEDWVIFLPHKDYVGKEVFFPIDFQKVQFSPRFLPANGDNPTYLIEAILNFLVNVAYINLFDTTVRDLVKTKGEENALFSFLIHTSGKTVDHAIDETIVNKLFDVLSNENHKLYTKYVERLHTIATQKYGQSSADDIVKFVLLKIERKFTQVLNAESKARRKVPIDLTDPLTIFTVIIGGNIISRGITFNNLLGMFFTRDVKHKMQQDTYIQRARMFGNRNNYLKYFELWIPEQLYLDWHKCFVYHQLSLEAIKADKKAPVWISDDRVQPIAKSSIDKRSVVSASGEMYFAKFSPDKLDEIINSKKLNEIEKIKKINETYGNKALPSYLIEFTQISSYPGNIAIHNIRQVGKDTEYHDSLYRLKGVLGGMDINKFPNALHHFMVISNTNNEARVVYKYASKVQFLTNLKK